MALGTWMGASAGYWWMEAGSRSWVDCAFMAFITITTIGYEETIPLTSAGAKWYTMGVGALGVANLAFVTSSLFAWLVETDPKRRRRAMQKKIEKLEGHYVICGLGRAGARVAERLAAEGKPFVGIDPEETKTAGVELSVTGDASEEQALKAAGVERAAGVFAVTGDDAKNLMITLAAREMAPKARIVARAGDEKNARRMGKSGADATICPDASAGSRLAAAMLTPQAHGFFEEMSLAGGSRLVEARVGAEWARKTLGEYEKAAGGKARALALLRQGQWEAAPSKDWMLAEGDELLLLSQSGQ